MKAFISKPLSHHNCQRFCHHVDGCYGKAVCGRCGQKESDYTKNNGDIYAKARIEKKTLHILEYV